MLDLSRKELAVNGGRPIRTKKWKDNVTTGEEEKDEVVELLTGIGLDMPETH